MKAVLKSPEEIALIRHAGRIVADCHREISRMIAPGITTLEINEFAEAFISAQGASPEQKGYRGFPYATCASVNDVVCHGFPCTTPLRSGDIVTIDLVVNKDGWLADSGWTYIVGEPSEELKRLFEVTKRALYRGIEQAVPGKRIGDISCAIQRTAEEEGLGVVKALVGHGIGRLLHEAPDVPNYGRPGAGLKLKRGMVITIEPVFTLGPEGSIRWGSDGWTIRSADGSPGAQFEHTIAVEDGGPQILTE
ncbi:type I methionyl aminopeptidase [Paenibacillus sp. CAA11]|uniref:type I methionyl aminopeptidase n=1 Tax=Paenibacillus sp. CAA11 TaxID=1532905 RepID=UPI000D3DB12B|nr:type I methionyl aminopeptidase [Paenibacillus sp. CAA11]AWB43270.1 type I methionyl aminopeptidase [Paenibacillus sp. CAA11]